jgi:hypothetical protein
MKNWQGSALKITLLSSSRITILSVNGIRAGFLSSSISFGTSPRSLKSKSFWPSMMRSSVLPLVLSCC